jgi:hypothetical protein
MTNRFFNNLIDLLPLSKARSAQVEANFTAVQTGFDVTQEEVDAEIALRIENDDLEIATRIEEDALLEAKKVNLSGGTYTGTHNLTGALLQVADPQSPDQASSKRYVDSLLLGATNAATEWSASVNYTIGKVVYSPISFQSYRRKVAGTSATDPSLDVDNWAALSGGSSYGPINFLASSY